MNKEKEKKEGKLTDFKSSGHHSSLDASVDFGGLVNEITKTIVVFRNLGETLEHLIDSHAEKHGSKGVILAAVAWFSSGKLLDALIRAKEKGVTVMVVVQKEDFLRQDSKDMTREKFKVYLRDKYTRLGQLFTDYNTYESRVLQSADKMSGEDMTGEFYWDENYGDNSTSCEAVRCLGNHNSTGSPSFPRMHNKFMVFCVMESDTTDEMIEDLYAEKVWTGSFNCSACADKSFENALIIENECIATMYMREFAALFLLSESLDWTSEWMKPEVSYST